MIERTPIVNCALYWSNPVEFWSLLKTDWQTDYWTTATFPATWEGYFYGLRTDPRPFEPGKLFNSFRLGIAKLQHFPVGRYGIFRIAGPKGLTCLSEIASNLTKTISRRMDIRFDLAASRNPSRTVSATTPLRFRNFSKTEFLSVLSQPIGFHPNGVQIRTHRPRKPMMACLPTDQGILQFHWLETEGVFLGGGGELIISGKKVDLHLPLDLGKVPEKFGDDSYYRDWMHKEQTDKQTNKHSSLYI